MFYFRKFAPYIAMRKKTVIFILLSAFIFVMAEPGMPFFKSSGNKGVLTDSAALADTLLLLSDTVAGGDTLAGDSAKQTNTSNEPDTTKMDSLELAIYKHNKHIDDSVRLDSINRKKSNSIDAPVTFSSDDSLVYDATAKRAFLYGNSNVKYQNMDLKSDRVQMSLDSNLVHATGKADTTGKLIGKPVFVMGKDTYESDTISFNFKTKKGFINSVYTAQEDGFLTSEKSKRDSSGVLYLQHGRYTTCDQEHPDFYIALSRAKVRPGKDVVFGPAYLVVADVPLPLAIPYGFFPFTKSYSSGFIMPSYGDESSRGFYLRDGGYYFAINDKWDLKLLGEIYTKGSWGLSAASNYRKRYKYSGSFFFSYQNTKNGDKGMPDYAEQTSFKLQWSHRQDAKANPYTSLSASVNFASTSYERNNLSSMYNPQSYTQSLRTSSVSWSSSFSSIGLTLSGTANLSQNMIDSTVSLSLPDLNIAVSRFYPFKRKHMAGKERWYEKISVSYTGQLQNSIDTKESKLFKSNLIKDWRNAFRHEIPIQANFTLFKYININPSFNFTDRMYTNKETQSWDEENQEAVRDTTYGFYNVYDWRMSVSASTKLYGFWVPSRKIFGDKIQAIRHVLSPQVSFSYAPDNGSRYYETYQKTNPDGSVELVEYSPFQNSLYGIPSRGKTGSITFDLGNNLEMKIKSDKDSTGFKKISLIDEFGLNMGYNMADKERPWSDLTMRIRLKWWKNYTFNLNAVFATYAYELDENGNPYVGTHTEYSKGRFGRFQGMSQNISFTLTPEKIKKWFGGGDDEDKEKDEENEDTDNTDIESNVDDDLVRGQHGAEKESAGKAETDEDGYMKFSMPWSLTFGYGISMRENTSGKFNKKTMRYPYKFTQTLNFSGNIRISDGWNISFSSPSSSAVLAPYTSYNFSFRCNAATLTDALKYDKRSGFSNAVQWY